MATIPVIPKCVGTDAPTTYDFKKGVKVLLTT